ncbi:MAG: GFA family protein, partial [Steroidobacteraceae bacterium]
LESESALSEYTFNRHHIKHQFCAVCGCAPFAFGKDSKGADTVAINVRCLPELDISALKVTHFDGRSL